MEYAREQYNEGYKTPTALLLASLLLHLLLLYWCLQQGILDIEQFLPDFTATTTHEWADTDATEIADPNLPAALRAGASSFGVPIAWVPDDDPTLGTDEQIENAQLSGDATMTQENEEANAPMSFDKLPITLPTSLKFRRTGKLRRAGRMSAQQPSSAELLIQNPQGESEKQMVDQNTTNDAITLSSEQNKNETHKALMVSDSEREREIVSNRMSAQDATQSNSARTEASDFANPPSLDSGEIETPSGRPSRRQRKKRTGVGNTQGSAGMRRLTIADLANGFLDSIRGDGPDLADRAGDPNKRPDAIEMKKLNYLYALVWNMQNEWRIKSHKLRLQSHDPFALTVKIVIKRDGTLHHIAVVESTGVAAYDEFMIKGIKRASPYPPVPSYIKTDMFDITITFMFNSQMPDYAQSQLMGSSLLQGKP
ncbi:MAG: TonB family protein [Candidatus Babeliales bacterium]